MHGPTAVEAVGGLLERRVVVVSEIGGCTTLVPLDAVVEAAGVVVGDNAAVVVVILDSDVFPPDEQADIETSRTALKEASLPRTV